jgi:uncharacterized protein YndB with AHSA1/START domain
MTDIKHQITITATAGVIYNLFTTKAGIQKWLTKEDGWKITGNEKLGDTLSFYFGGDHHEMRISKLTPNKEVKWECTVGHPEWIGTSVSFTIENKDGKSILFFAHKGWKSKTAWFEQCSQVWEGSIADVKKAAEK